MEEVILTFQLHRSKVTEFKYQNQCDVSACLAIHANCNTLLRIIDRLGLLRGWWRVASLKSCIMHTFIAPFVGNSFLSPLLTHTFSWKPPYLETPLVNVYDCYLKGFIN